MRYKRGDVAKVGDIVLIHNDGCFCTTYPVMADKMGLTLYKDDNDSGLSQKNDKGDFVIYPPVRGMVVATDDCHIGVRVGNREYVLFLNDCMYSDRYLRKVSPMSYLDEGLFEL